MKHIISIKNKCISNDRKSAQEQIDIDGHGLHIVEEIPAPLINGKINFNVSEFLLSDLKTKIGIFHVKPVYYINNMGNARPMDEIMSYSGNKRMELSTGWENKVDFSWLRWLTNRQAMLGSTVMLPMSRVPVALATTGTFYPSPIESVTMDGRIKRTSGIDTTWTFFHDAAAGTGPSVDDISFNDSMLIQGLSSGWLGMVRFFYLFDTSIISGGRIFSGTFSLWLINSTDEIGSQSESLVSTNPVSNTALVGTDYSKVGTTHFSSDIAISAMSTGGYNTHTLNPAGLTAIDTFGVTKFGTRLVSDTDDSEPARVGAYKQTILNQYFSEQTGTANDPRLILTYGVSTVRTFNVQ